MKIDAYSICIEDGEWMSTIGIWHSRTIVLMSVLTQVVGWWLFRIN